MQHRNRLEQVLNDPASTAEERELARQRLGSDPTQLEVELTAALGKPLLAVEYMDIHKFCRERGWTNSRALFDRWLTSHFQTKAGRRDLQRAAEYLRESDLIEWDASMVEWRDSDWKSPQRLIAALETIAASPARGNYHDALTVEHAAGFLSALRRRVGATA
jgi:hypothetical protein